MTEIIKTEHQPKKENLQINDAVDVEVNKMGKERDLSKMIITDDAFRNEKLKKVRAIINLDNESPETKIFNEGEVFDPDVEVKNIRQGSRSEQKEKLSLFKQKLAYQKRGIAKIQSALYEKLKSNNFVTREGLDRSFMEMEKDYALSDYQTKVISNAIKICEKRHNGIVENVADYLEKDGSVDGKKLYKKLFKRPPVGEVEVIVGPISLYFKTHRFYDFQYIATREYEKEENAYKWREALDTGGIKLNNFWVKSLEDAIIVENGADVPSWFRPFYHKEFKGVFKHEDQHSFNSLIDEALQTSGNQESSNQNKLDSSNSLDDKRETRDTNVELFLEDEICAYFKDGLSAKKIRKIFLGEKTIYVYGHKYKEEEKKFGEKFSAEYIALVENSIVAIFDLVKNGYTKDDAVAILYPENLSAWPKVVSRQLGKYKTRIEKERDRRRLLALPERIVDWLDNSADILARRLLK